MSLIKPRTVAELRDMLEDIDGERPVVLAVKQYGTDEFDAEGDFDRVEDGPGDSVVLWGG